MQQILFRIPDPFGWFGPDGIAIHGFGVMLFITFILGVWMVGWRARVNGTNFPQKHVSDFVIAIFVGGLIGARITYMIQYKQPWQQFVRIWEGGIVLYGGIITGFAVFLFIYFKYLRKLGVSFWKLADAIAPGIALGIALGRVGCFLNGCCFGHVAPMDCPSVGFPVLTCSARDIVVDQNAYQTPLGFTVRPGEDVRSVVRQVEPESNAERAGLLPGDRIVGTNGQPNAGVLLVLPIEPDPAKQDAIMANLATIAREQGGVIDDTLEPKSGRIKFRFDDLVGYAVVRGKFKMDLSLRVYDMDSLVDSISSWKRGEQSLSLVVERDGKRVTLPTFVPRTIGLHPTQLYETVSMLLLTLFLLVFYRFRHHDGQIFTLLVFFYAIHRFMNEILRNDTPVEGFGMTLSQNISVVMFSFAVILEITLRRRTPARVAQQV